MQSPHRVVIQYTGSMLFALKMKVNPIDFTGILTSIRQVGLACYMQWIVTIVLTHHSGGFALLFNSLTTYVQAYQFIAAVMVSNS